MAYQNECCAEVEILNNVIEGANEVKQMFLNGCATESFEKKAINAFLEEWISSVYSIKILYEDGINNLHMAYVLLRTSLEIFSQLKFLLSDKRELQKKSIYAFAITNYNINKLNENVRILKGTDANCKEFKEIQDKSDIFKFRQSAAWNKLSDNEKNIFSTCKDKIKEKGQYYYYWYNIDNNKKFKLSRIIDTYGPSKFKNDNKLLYDYLSKYAHGLNTLANIDYGNKNDATFGIHVIFEMYKNVVDIIGGVYFDNVNKVTEEDIIYFTQQSKIQLIEERYKQLQKDGGEICEQ